jgi:aminoglycoside 6'-N-acetyltransferase
MDVQLRRATVDDIPLLHEWDRDPDVLASSGEDGGDFDWDFEVPRDVSWRELLIAEVDGEPVGFMQLIDAAEEETHYWGDLEQGPWAIDIWIGSSRHRGQGIGESMMRQALDRCFARPGVDHVLIDPLLRNERAIRFYERIGFTHVGVRWFDTDECAVMRFDRKGS